MRSLERVNIRTNVRTYVLTYIRTGQTLYPLHNFVVRGDNKKRKKLMHFLFASFENETLLKGVYTLTPLHSHRPKLYGVLAVLSALGLRKGLHFQERLFS